MVFCYGNAGRDPTVSMFKTVLLIFLAAKLETKITLHSKADNKRIQLYTTCMSLTTIILSESSKIQKNTQSLIPFTKCSKISKTKLHNSGIHTNLEKLWNSKEIIITKEEFGEDFVIPFYDLGNGYLFNYIFTHDAFFPMYGPYSQFLTV